MFRLRCAFQTYDWGKFGADSEVYKLLRHSGQIQELDGSKPYAELWMGTHVSGPSFLMDDRSMSLGNYISKNVQCLGSTVSENFGNVLPFLFKVLSVRKALSIQAHPDKDCAAKLHHARPDLYKDANHKPEIAIALTPFEAMVAFRPSEEIGTFAKYIPELHAVIGPDFTNDLLNIPTADKANSSQSIKAAYSRLMNANPTVISDLVETLKRRLTNGEKIIIPPVKNHILDTEVLGNVFVRLATDYPGDVGCFSLFFFNYIKLNPGEAIFLEPNLPHAYLFGDCVECMASSDNVIRAGLTPKFKDVDHLLRIIQYEPRWGSALKFAGQRKTIEPIDSCIIASNDNVPEKSKVQDDALVVSEIVTFSPPVDDFAVDRISISGKHKTVQFPPLKSASILIIIHGKGTLQRLHLDVLRTSAFICESVEFDEGSVFFISAGVSFCIHQFLQESNSYILAFRAYANVSTD
ncbi:putative mannose-6-phosphate isomerase [Schistosoma japonicum]|nr:putative mannose-6-phosphate isomerase [Schistosoma japonicum]